jgi:hypothetical protein
MSDNDALIDKTHDLMNDSLRLVAHYIDHKEAVGPCASIRSANSVFLKGAWEAWNLLVERIRDLEKRS